MTSRVALQAIVALFVFAAVAAAIGYAFVRGHGFSARATPGRLETALARGARRLAIPASASRRVNTLPQTAATLRAGLGHFADHCAMCHGNDGGGDTEMGRGLYPKAPDMRLAGTQSLSDGEIFYIIENGVPLTGMPAWGDGGPESEKASWHLVQFVRHLPKLSPEETAAMRALNPRSPNDNGIDPDEFLKGGDPIVPAPMHKHGGGGQ